MIETIEDMAANILADAPTTIQGLAPQTQDQYTAALAEFAGMPLSPAQTTLAAFGPMAGFHETDPKRMSTEMFRQTMSATGKVLYSNGVIADPVNNAVYYDPVSNAPGSTNWLRKEAANWSVKKADQWRKKLINLGYEPPGGLAEKGGVAVDLLDALKMYHDTRWLFGKSIRMRPESKEAKENIKGQIDRAALRADVQNWYQTAGLGDADDDEVSFWEDRIVEATLKYASKGMTPAGAFSKAQNQQAEKFMEVPEVEEAFDIAQHQEMSTALKDKLVSLSQIASI